MVMPLSAGGITIFSADRGDRTLTLDYGKLPPLELANECILAFDTMLAEGDPSKKELLMQICVRMLIKPVLNKIEGTAKFIEFLLVHKEEILSNKYIAEDKGLSDALNNIYSRSGFDENGNVVYNY